MRIHRLAALGACAARITGQRIFYEHWIFGATPDPARLSAQVITGAGFPGAGTIVREGAPIKPSCPISGASGAQNDHARGRVDQGPDQRGQHLGGACLGAAMGAGFFIVDLVGAGCMLVMLSVFKWLRNTLLCGGESCSLCHLSP